MPLSQRLGALQERDFRLLFAATTITTVGDRLAGIALVFAVLDHGVRDRSRDRLRRPAGRPGARGVGGGVLSDRFPRNLVLVGASLVQGAAQAATAALVLTGTAGGVDPRSRPSTASGRPRAAGGGGARAADGEPVRLQQANALQGMSRNMIGVIGPAVGGAVVVG